MHWARRFASVVISSDLNSGLSACAVPASPRWCIDHGLQRVTVPPCRTARSQLRAAGAHTQFAAIGRALLEKAAATE
jgi:hypothetical protein